MLSISLFISSPFVLGFIFRSNFVQSQFTSPSYISSHEEGMPCGSFELDQDPHCNIIRSVISSRNEKMHRNVGTKRHFNNCLSILSYARSSYICLGLSCS